MTSRALQHIQNCCVFLKTPARPGVAGVSRLAVRRCSAPRRAQGAPTLASWEAVGGRNALRSCAQGGSSVRRPRRQFGLTAGFGTGGAATYNSSRGRGRGRHRWRFEWHPFQTRPRQQRPVRRQPRRPCCCRVAASTSPPLPDGSARPLEIAALASCSCSR